ncbi:MAG TPA: hypothetical protein VHN81_01265 [Edaphobacter sp.]|nr:hypothetical protein [Edaphobacter sp.]
MNLLSLSALFLSAGVGMQAQPQSAVVPAPPPVPVTDVMVLLTRKPNVSVPDLMKVLPEEARETMLMYLDGKIDHWYSRADGRGVVFFLRCSSVEEAKAMMGSLPLDKAGMVDLEFIPVGPLAPMRFLTRPQTGESGPK